MKRRWYVALAVVAALAGCARKAEFEQIRLAVSRVVWKFAA